MKLSLCSSEVIVAMLASALTSQAAHPFQNESRHLGPDLGRAGVIEPGRGKPRAVLVCLHGIQSNRDWWVPLGEALEKKGIALWAFNRPGSGNPPPTGPADVTSADLLEWARQMDAVNAAARRKYGDVPVFATGVSWGASPALLASRDRRDPGTGVRWAGAILLNPAFATTRDGAFMGGVLGHFLLPWNWGKPIRIPIQQDDYTSCRDTKQTYLQEHQLKKTATYGFLKRTQKVKKEALAELRRPGVPLLILLGAADRLATPQRFTQQTGLHRQSTRELTVDFVPDATHAAIVERERQAIARRVVLWISEHMK